MSDQVYEDPDQPDSSYKADVDKGYDADDRSDAGIAGSGLTGDEAATSREAETSHEADIDAGYDEGTDGSGAADAADR